MTICDDRGEFGSEKRVNETCDDVSGRVSIYSRRFGKVLGPFVTIQSNFRAFTAT